MINEDTSSGTMKDDESEKKCCRKQDKIEDHHRSPSNMENLNYCSGNGNGKEQRDARDWEK